MGGEGDSNKETPDRAMELQGEAKPGPYGSMPAYWELSTSNNHILLHLLERIDLYHCSIEIAQYNMPMTPKRFWKIAQTSRPVRAFQYGMGILLGLVDTA